MSESKKPLTLQEILQITDVLYPWIANIKDLPVKILLEEMKDEAPCLTFVQEKGGGKSNYNVIGDYDGEYIFSIFYKINGKSTKSRLDATRVLLYIGAVCESATEAKNLPKINIKDESKSLTIVDNPTLVVREENGHELYQATYSFVYRHKKY